MHILYFQKISWFHAKYASMIQTQDLATCLPDTNTMHILIKTYSQLKIWVTSMQAIQLVIGNLKIMYRPPEEYHVLLTK